MNYKRIILLSILIITFIASIMFLVNVISKSNEMISVIDLSFHDGIKNKSLSVESSNSNYSLCNDINRGDKQVACFDGKNNFINVPITKFSNKKFKLSFWVKFNDFQAEQPLIYIKSKSNEAPQFFYISTYQNNDNYNGLYFGVTGLDGKLDKTVYNTNESMFELNKWYNIIVNADIKQKLIEVKKDSFLVASLKLPMDELGGEPSEIFIGSKPEKSLYFNGSLDNISISYWNEENISYISIITFFIKILAIFMVCFFLVTIFNIIKKRNLKQIFSHIINPLDLFLLSIVVYIISATLFIHYFTIKGKTNYLSFNEYTLYPLLIILLTILLYQLIWHNLSKTNQEIWSKILKKQIVIGLIYLSYYFTALTFGSIILYHIIISASVLLNDILTHYYDLDKVLKKVAFIVLLSITFVIILVDDNTWIVFDSSRLSEKKVFQKHQFDGWSEKNVFNASRYYNEKGWFKYYLLPVTDYPGALVTNHPDQVILEDFIYTHYPCGPELTAGVLCALVGKDDSLNLNKYRFFPLILFFISYIFLILFLKEILNKNDILALMLAFLIIFQPAVRLHKLNLHYMSYAMSFLFIQLFFALKYVSTKKQYLLWFVGICNFIQGWISFDFIPIVVISNLLVVFIYYSYQEKYKFNKKDLYPLYYGIAFLFIVGILRIVQNSLYFGSIAGAINDLSGAYQFRALNTFSGLPADHFFVLHIFQTYKNLINGTIQAFYFNIPLVEINTILICLIFLCLAFRVNLSFIRTSFNQIKHLFFILLTCTISGFIWIFMMKNHAAIHLHILPRHMIMLFIGIIIILAVIIRNNISSNSNLNN